MPYSDFRGDQMILRDLLARDRTTLANERTLLAYIRTALMLLIAAVTVYKLFARDASYYVVLAALLAASGTAALLVGMRRYFSVRRNLTRIK